ncbi:MAG: hypothetical protein OHK0050_13090 [Roseiflexaceae bacterium]
MRWSWIGPDHLYGLVLFILAACLLALVPNGPHDFWWHLEVGRLIASDRLPTANIRAWTLPPEQPYVYAGWLAEYCFYLLVEWGGLIMPGIARNLLGFLALALVTTEALRRTRSWLLAGAAALLVTLLGFNNLSVRPQSFVWPLVAAYLLLLGAWSARQIRSRLLLLLPIMMLAWVNLHGSFPLGIVLIGLVGIGELGRILLKDPGACSWARWGELVGVGLSTILATLANPLGLELYRYVGGLLSNATVRGQITEWQPPTPADLSGRVLVITVIGLIAALALGRRRLSLPDTLLIAATLWIAWDAVRNVIWFGMVVAPMLAQALSLPQRPPRPGNPIGLLIAGLLSSALLVVQPPLKAQLPLPASYQQLFVEWPEAPGVYSSDTPVQASTYLRANPAKRLFNDLGFGSYLWWAAPNQQLFVDARIELYPTEIWKDYIAISAGQNLEALLDQKYAIDTVFLSLSAQPILDQALADRPDQWQEVYRDQQAAIYRRISLP